MNKRKRILLMAFVFIGQVLIAQNKDSYFKVPYKPSPDFPEWVNEMYKGDPNVYKVEQLYNQYYRDNLFEKNTHTQNYKHWLNQIQPFITEEGLIREAPNNNIVRNQKKQRLSSELAGSTTGANWVQSGPFQTYDKGGKGKFVVAQANVYSIAIAPSNHSILFCTTESGGVFKSVDKGLNWQLVSLNETFTTGADVTIDPVNPNIVYVATGKDIYKTIDQGTTWTLLHSFGDKLQQLLIQSTNSSRIFAATDGGLYRSEDTGQTWTQLFPERTWDIVEHVSQPNVIYAAISNTSLSSAQVVRSTNNGTSWTLKNTGWYVPTDPANARDLGCKLAVTEADPNRIYAALIGESKAGDNGWIGVYYSLNNANNWVNADGIDGGPYNTSNPYWAGYSSGYHQGWYNFDLDVSDINPDKIWVGTIWDLESSDRGATFEYFRSTRKFDMHADVQDIEVVGSDVWIVSDGGINYSNDEMQTTEARQKGISASNFWGFDQGWNEDVWAGGRYHNGDGIYKDSFGFGNTLFLGGAEAPTGHINVLDNKKAYFKDISTVTIGDNITDPIQVSAKLAMFPNSSYSTLRSSDLKVDPRYGNHFFLGNGNQFFKSTDAGATFEAIFDFASGSLVLEFEIGRINPDIIYAVVLDNTNNCHLYKSINGGNDFTQIADIPDPSSRYMAISLNPTDDNNLWVANNQYKTVYKTTDGGISWQNMTTSTLAGVKGKDIVYQGGTDDLVYLFSDEGVFYFDTQTNDWIDFSNGLPVIPSVKKAIPFYKGNKLRVATSRGVWETPLAQESNPVAQPISNIDTISCTNERVVLDSYSIVPQDGVSWEWSISPEPYYMSSRTDRKITVQFSQPGPQSVTLKATRNGISDSKTVENLVTVLSSCDGLADVPTNALEFNGINSDAYANNVLNKTGNNFTMIAWIKPKGIQKDYTGILVPSNAGYAYGLNFLSNNEIGYHWDGATSWGWHSGLFAPADQWSHVALVIEPTGATIYLNGEPSKHVTNLSSTALTSLYLGSDRRYANRFYNGQMDEVQIWNRALSQNEIREIRHLTRNIGQHYSDNLIAYYQFNENAGPVANGMGSGSLDLSGNAKLVASSAPVAEGSSQRITIKSAGQYILDTNVDMNLNFSTVNPNGEIVVSKLKYVPNVAPEQNYLSNKYWIINNYGANKTFDNLPKIEFDIRDEVNSPIATILDPIALTKRTSNEHLNNWVYYCSSTVNNGWLSFENCGIVDFSQFYFTGGVPLPLKLITFDASATQNNDIELNWSIISKEDLDYFIVENSTDGINWSEIAKISDVNNHGNSFKYKHSDFLGNSQYYRIKLVDKQGLVDYSSIDFVQLNIEQEIKFVLNDTKSFSVINSNSKPARIKVFSGDSKLKYDGFVEGNSTKLVDMSKSAAGIYYVGVQTENRIYTKSVLVSE